MKNPEKKKKKKKRRIITLIVVALVLVFLWWPVDEEYYDEAKTEYDTAEVGQALGGYGSNNRDALASYFGSNVIRDHYVKLKGNGEDKVTLLVYMNGSNLESDDQEATGDLKEMIKGAGVSDKVNILVQTMGTKKWSPELGISSKRTERYKLDGNGIELVDSGLSQLDCTRTSTLADFIRWGASNYPADRYILLFWDHGGGAVYGFGSDEWVSDEYAALTIDEMQAAFKQAGVYFDFIGMDCCIMSSLEVCCAFYDFCDYTILSEDFESGLGWYYTNWIKELYKNTSITTPALGKLICDDMVQANISDTRNGDNSILALIDQSMVKLLYASWKEFAYQTETELKSKNFSRAMKPKQGGRVLDRLALQYGDDDAKSHKLGFLYDFFTDDTPTLEDYYEVDIMSAASSIDSDVSEVLKTAIANTLVYVAYSEGDSHLTGLAVSLPYGDEDGYESMQEIFRNVGMDDEYINWLGQFVYIQNSDDYYNYDDFDDSWYGWDSYEDYYDDDEYDDYDDFWSWFFEDDDYYDDDYGFDDYGYDDFFWNWLFDDDDDYYGDYSDYDDYCNNNDYGYYDDYYDDDYDDDGWGWFW